MNPCEFAAPCSVFSIVRISSAFVFLTAMLGTVHAKDIKRADGAHGTYVWVDPPTTVAAEDDVPRLLYLNRCADGCTFTPGADNAIENTSQIVQTTVNMQPFPYGDEVWDEVVACVRDQYAAFNINITDQDPGTTPHFESIVAGDANDVAPGAGGIAPFSCGVLPNSINFTFAETLGGNAQNLCEVVAQESGHVLGLEHVLLCEDPMTYLSGCGPKKFKDISADCGESSPRPCECGNEQQNSVQHLLGVFGPGSQSATAELAITDVEEAPDQVDGNGVLEPGETVRITVSLSNRGNELAQGITFSLKAGGNLKLQPMDPIDLEGGNTINVKLEVEVRAKACSKDVDFEVVTKLGGESWSAESSVSVGIVPSSQLTGVAEMQTWEVSDKTPAAQGAWEYGVPSFSTFGGRVVQPRGGGSGESSSAWITGLEGEWDESAVIGKTSLVSSKLEVGTWNKITGINYRLWYFAFSRANGSLDPSMEKHLVVELSSNGGSSWTEIDAIDTGELFRWDMRSVTFPPLNATDNVKLRFTVQNEGDIEDRLIEVGIDEVTLVGGELLCTPTDGGGCGCQSSGSGNGGWILFLGVLAFTFRRRRVSA